VPGEPAPARVLEHAAAGVWTTDLDGVTTYVNAAASALAGIPACELVGFPLATFFDEEPQMIHARLSPSAERQDRRLVRADGGELWVSMTTTPLTDSRGRRLGTVSTLSDISDRKRLEVDLRLRAAAHEAVTELAESALAGEPMQLLIGRAAATAAEYATVCDVEPAREEAVPLVVLGWKRSWIGRRVPIPANSPADLCLGDDEPVIVSDYDAMEAVPRGGMTAEVRARSAVCVRIAGGGGFLAATSPRTHAFDGQDLCFMRSIAAVLGSRWRLAPPPLAAVPA
jgi:PAS domain S-box-containing protein